MGVREDVLAGVREIFTELGNVIVNATYESLDLSSTTYDPVAGAVTPVQNTGSPFTLSEVFLYDSRNSLIELALGAQQELTENELITKKMIVIQQDLPVTPKKEDKLTANSIEYIVRKFRADPTDSIWLFDFEGGA